MNSLTTHSIILIALVLSLNSTGSAQDQDGRELSPDEAAAYYQILQDAQRAHKDALQHGRAVVELDYTSTARRRRDRDRLNHTVQLQAEVTWDGPKMLLKYRAVDPKGVVTARPEDPDDPASQVPLPDRPQEIILHTPDNHVVYNPVHKLAFIRPPESGKLPRLLRLAPQEHWTSCCPPIAPGRPWVEMIGPSPVLSESEFTLRLENDGRRLRQIREDSDGGRQETVFSLDHRGYVVESSYFRRGRREPMSWVSYEWDPPVEDHCALRACEARRTDDDQTIEYRLRVLELDRSKPLASAFSRPSVLRQLPKGAKVHDRAAGRTFWIGGPPQPASMAERLQELIEQARDKGFGKPKSPDQR